MKVADLQLRFDGGSSRRQVYCFRKVDENYKSNNTR